MLVGPVACLERRFHGSNGRALAFELARSFLVGIAIQGTVVAGRRAHEGIARDDPQCR